MRSLLGDRLLHFLALGALLFVAYEWLSSGSAELGPNQVLVDRAAVLDFIQYRSKAFDLALAEKRLAALSDTERERLIGDLVREEVLHREALALGLGEDDYVIKRRLIQKLEFITQGFAASGSEPTEAELTAFFEERREEYAVEAWVTFTHVFFDAEKHGAGEARALARAELDALNQGGVAFSEAIGRGDRFLYHRNYVERTKDFVHSHFGAEITSIVFEGDIADGVWLGPVASAYGFHLVLVMRREEGRLPDLDEVRGRVAEDARQAAIRARTEQALQAIIDRYEVRVDLSPRVAE